MSKQDFQGCMLHANQLSMLNYQKLACVMQPSEVSAKIEYAHMSSPKTSNTQTSIKNSKLNSALSYGKPSP